MNVACGRPKTVDGISTALLPLRARFIALNAERAAELSILRNRLKRDQASEASLLEIGDIVHKIAGVAATLGFAELGKLSLQLDRITMALRAEEVALAPAWLQAEPLLDQLIDLISA